MAREWTVGEGTDLADALRAVRRAAHRPDQAGVLQPAAHRAPPRPEPREHQGGRQEEHRGALRPVERDVRGSSSTPRCRYSSALFDTLDPAPTLADLEAAQLHKIDAILDSAGVSRGSRVLEIGTGWGSLAIRAAQRGATVTSLTLSAEQAGWPGSGSTPPGSPIGSRSRLRDYRDAGRRVRRRGQRRDDRGRRRGVLAGRTSPRSTRCSPPGGKAAIQAILIAHDRLVATRHTYSWIHKYIFPGGLLPSTDAIEPGHRASTRRCTSRHPADRPALRPHAAAVARAVRRQLGAVQRARLRRAVPPDVGVLPRLLRGRLPHRLPRRRADPHRALTHPGVVRHARQRRTVTVPATRSCRPRRSRL